MKTLRVILWDQLSHSISSLKKVDPPQDVILMCEVKEECTYVKHHKKKLVFLLSAMRHFAAELLSKNYQVEYVQLDTPHNTQTLAGEIKRAFITNSPDQILVTWPGEYRILQALIQLKNELSVPLHILEDDRFLAARDEFKSWAKAHKLLRMEFFYRHMRQQYHILMNGDEPEGGKWNFDVDNRQFPKDPIKIPDPFRIQPDGITKDVIDMVTRYFADHFGDIEPCYFAINRNQALKALHLFIKERLALFGDYQDVMLEQKPWLYHSQISFYLNVGFLHPLECIKAAQLAYHQGYVSLNSAEGFIRQILGWREFIRGIYWLKMPDYKNSNFLNATRPLPSFYWTADTNMNCIKQCVTETKNNAYAHHIQRLMVLGNFALLAGINPDEVNEWYLLVYADAHEWVELPNVTGMILYADAGYVASKPYIGSGAYINKMSNYCQQCVYNVKEKIGKKACPFNYLYWNFLIRHRALLKNNQRLRMMYSSLARMDAKHMAIIQSDAKVFLESLD